MPVYMESKRVLLSDELFHEVVLSEQSMGVICHALDTLAIAFSLETQYYECIQQAAGSVKAAFGEDAKIRRR